MGQDARDLPTLVLYPVGTPVPPENTIMVAVPQGYTVVVQREDSPDPTIISVIADPSQTVVINGVSTPVKDK